MFLFKLVKVDKLTDVLRMILRTKMFDACHGVCPYLSAILCLFPISLYFLCFSKAISSPSPHRESEYTYLAYSTQNLF